MRKNPGFALRSVCGEQFLIAEGIENIDFSKLIALNESSAYLWQNIADDEEFDVETLVELLEQEYVVKHKQAISDVTSLCQSMINAGIISK